MKYGDLDTSEAHNHEVIELFAKIVKESYFVNNYWRFGSLLPVFPFSLIIEQGVFTNRRR